MRPGISCLIGTLFFVVKLSAADIPGVVTTEPQGIRSVKIGNGYMGGEPTTTRLQLGSRGQQAR